MTRLTISINGAEYPCSPTMGAMLRFKEQTGKEINEIEGSFSELCVYLWCCLKSASAREGISFNFSLMEFADSVMPDDIAQWSKSLQELAGEAKSEEAGDEDSEKKRP